MAGKETVNPGMRVRSNEPCQRDVGRSRTPRRYPHFPRDGSSSQAARPFRRPSSSKRSGWGRPSSPGVTRTGEYASPRPTARTWARIWGQTQEAGYALAGSSVPSMAMSSTQPASASPRPMPTPPPKTARLQVFKTQEVSGLIFAWWGIEGREPQWSLPSDPLEHAGWSKQEIRTIRFAGTLLRFFQL